MQIEGLLATIQKGILNFFAELIRDSEVSDVELAQRTLRLEKYVFLYAFGEFMSSSYLLSVIGLFPTTLA